MYIVLSDGELENFAVKYQSAPCKGAITFLNWLALQLRQTDKVRVQ